MPIDSKAKEPDAPHEPWRSFLRDFDSQLKGAVALRCLGGFVITQQYGLGRSTSDIDFLSVTTTSADDNIEILGGLGSSLYQKYRIYLQYVGIATPPCDYAQRLRRMFPKARWTKLQLFALDPVDLALSKLERNSDRDREDVLRLAQAGLVDGGVLRARYIEEVRPYLLNKEEWHDRTLDLWVEMIA
jgi:hypothetical protein